MHLGIPLWTLTHCTIMDTFMNTVQLLWLWILKTYRSSDATRLSTNFGMFMNNWTIHTQVYLSTVINMTILSWAPIILLKSAVLISHLKLSINTKYISTVGYTYHCMVLTWQYPTKQNHISVHSVSISLWPGEAMGSLETTPT